MRTTLLGLTEPQTWTSPRKPGFWFIAFIAGDGVAVMRLRTTDLSAAPVDEDGLVRMQLSLDASQDVPPETAQHEDQ